jgi:adenosine deaminase CECR1
MAVVMSMLGYETAYREHFRRILWKFAEEGISYAEIRFALDYGLFIKSDDGTQSLGVPEIVKLLSDVLKEEVPKIRAKGHSFWSIKVIYACMRNSPKDAMKWQMDTAIAMKQQYPDIICGEYVTIIQTPSL